MSLKDGTTMDEALEQAINKALAPLMSELQNLRHEIASYRNDLTDDTRLYTIGQVCKAANCSRSTFKKYWQIYKLPMPEPRTTASQRPRYSQADIYRLQEALRR